MKGESWSIVSLVDIIDYDIRKVAEAEAQLESILPDWINKATALMLKTVLQEYYVLIKQNRQNIFAIIEEEEVGLPSRTNIIMQAFILEAREQMINCVDPEVTDASLILSIQSINHYKINMYGGVGAFAKVLGKEGQARIFHQAKLNEEHIDRALTQLAEAEINIRARSHILLLNRK